MSSTFSSLSVVRGTVQGLRADLQKIRSLNGELTKKIAATNDRSRFSDAYITQQVALARAEAHNKADAYLAQREAKRHFASMHKQAEYWTVPSYLSRAGSGASEQVALLKTLVVLQSAQRMTLPALRAVADMGVETKDWSKVSAVYNEMAFRAITDSDARVAVAQMDATLMDDIPDIMEAKSLITESRRLEEFMGYSLRVLSNGGDDLGLKMEEAERIGRTREEGRA